MSELIVPPLVGDGEWPSLGSQVADWQEASLAFGPGDLLGKPYLLDEEDRAFLERGYQVYPPDHRGACRFEVAAGGWRCTRGSGACGRRRFKTVVIMTRKGTKKSERGGALAAVELAADGPVRCDGWRREQGMLVPVGRPVTSPAVFVFAFAKEQAEDTAWDSLTKMIEEGPAADRFAVWEERILRRDGSGEARAMASAPNSRDGARTTFQLKEEAHRWTSERLHEAHATTTGNLSKRPIADPWEAHLTTAYAPGEASVAEELHDAARKLAADPVAARRSPMFFFYRWADDRIAIRDAAGDYDPEGLRRAVVDASGPVVARWSDVEDIVARQFLLPGADGDYAERVWLNRTRQRRSAAFDAEAWKRSTRPRERIADGATVVAAFDGSRGTLTSDRPPDHAGIILTDVVTGRQEKFAHWDPKAFGGLIPRDLVDIAVDDLYTRFTVIRFYCDPPGWDPEIAAWRGRYGDSVVEWHTWRDRQMAAACASYATAISTGTVTNDGDPAFAAHVGNARRRLLNIRDDKGERMWTVGKENDRSEHKIDLAVTGVLSWEARNDAIASGVLNAEPAFVSVYETRGIAMLGAAT